MPSAFLGGAARGLLICSQVIIPSLFPFTVFSLIIFNCDILGFSKKFLGKISYFLFGLPANAFLSFIMSCFGGFPVGAKLVTNLYENDYINQNTAKRMLYYSVNPGPAFVIVAIGTAILSSKETGIIIYFSNIIASIILCFIFSFSERKEFRPVKNIIRKRKSISDIFVNSVSDAAASIISVCGFVILFSSISEMLREVLTFKNAEYIIALSEISQGAPLVAKNIYFLSFLTAFSGFCVHFQVISVAKNIEINYFKFLLARITSGLLSAGITFLLMKIFKITLPAIAEDSIVFKTGVKSLTLSAMLIFMSITLIISVKQKFVEKNRVM